ncbi:MAG: hypothetical protein KatS3mg060_0577 [Dehalococcoidia bacterium]|nr:MAG: hypothetical protein KatS3mg060_0577 [Dehalococcoidia bacterium]
MVEPTYTMSYLRLRLTGWKKAIALALAGAADREQNPHIGLIQFVALTDTWDVEDDELEAAVTELIESGVVVFHENHGIFSLTLPPSAPEGPLEALNFAFTQAAFNRALRKSEGTVLLGLLDSETPGETTREELYAVGSPRLVETGIARLVKRGWIEDDGERCRVVPLEEYRW